MSPEKSDCARATSLGDDQRSAPPSIPSQHGLAPSLGHAARALDDARAELEPLAATSLTNTPKTGNRVQRVGIWGVPWHLLPRHQLASATGAALWRLFLILAGVLRLNVDF